jgi:DNA modification methylase
MAAESAGRFCRGVELDPLYIDVILGSLLPLMLVAA